MLDFKADFQSSDVRKQLASLAHIHYSIDQFRLGQLEAMEAALSGQHLIAIIPTGGGKTLIFVLVALWMNKYHGRGTTVVIVPNKSLMQDSVRDLKAHKIDAEMWNADTDLDDTKRIKNRLSSSVPPVLLYICPERLNKQDDLAVLHSHFRLHRIVLDEVDMYLSASQQRFRPDVSPTTCDSCSI